MTSGTIDSKTKYIVDYKSTAGRRNSDKTALEPISLNGAYKESKRQMDVYQWICEKRFQSKY